MNNIQSFNVEETSILASQDFQNTTDNAKDLEKSIQMQEQEELPLVNTSDEAQRTAIAGNGIDEPVDLPKTETNDSATAEELVDVFQEDMSISSNTDEANLDDGSLAGYDDDFEDLHEEEDAYPEANDCYPEENENCQKDNTPTADKIGFNKLVMLMLDPAVQEYIAKTENNYFIFTTLCETTQKAISYTMLYNNNQI